MSSVRNTEIPDMPTESGKAGLDAQDSSQKDNERLKVGDLSDSKRDND